MPDGAPLLVPAGARLATGFYAAGTSKPAGAGLGVRGEAQGEAPRELSGAARRSRREAAAEVRAGLLPGGNGGLGASVVRAGPLARGPGRG
jgi:hypothetical protein